MLTGDVTFAPVSGTTYEFAKLADRMLSLGKEEPVFEWFFTSSNGVHWHFSNEAGKSDEVPKKAAFGMFQEIALGGGAWRPDIDSHHDVVYSGGVERTVGDRIAGIGYAVQGPRQFPVKVLALAATDGSGPTSATEEAIYSGRYPLQRKLYAVVAAPSLEKAPPAVREMVNLLLSDQGQTLMVRTRSLPLAAAEAATRTLIRSITS